MWWLSRCENESAGKEAGSLAMEARPGNLSGVRNDESTGSEDGSTVITFTSRSSSPSSVTGGRAVFVCLTGLMPPVQKGSTRCWRWLRAIPFSSISSDKALVRSLEPPSPESRPVLL